MKVFLVILNALLCLSFAQAQDRASAIDWNIVQDECGEFSSASESQIYETREGKIVKIIDGNTLLFESKIENGKRERFTINLAGIKASRNTKKFLKKNLLNKKFTVKGNIFRANNQNHLAIVYGKTAKLLEVNCFMLRNGIAEYEQFESNNIVPDSKTYYYKKAEDKAVNEKLGIWAK